MVVEVWLKFLFRVIFVRVAIFDIKKPADNQIRNESPCRKWQVTSLEPTRRESAEHLLRKRKKLRYSDRSMLNCHLMTSSSVFAIKMKIHCRNAKLLHFVLLCAFELSIFFPAYVFWIFIISVGRKKSLSSFNASLERKFTIYLFLRRS